VTPDGPRGIAPPDRSPPDTSGGMSAERPAGAVLQLPAPSGFVHHCPSRGEVLRRTRHGRAADQGRRERGQVDQAIPRGKVRRPGAPGRKRACFRPPTSPAARFSAYGPLPRPRIQLAQRTASDTIAVKAPRWSRAQSHLRNPSLDTITTKTRRSQMSDRKGTRSENYIQDPGNVDLRHGRAGRDNRC